MQYILEALNGFLSFDVLIVLVLGVIAGIIGGGLPGISPSMTIALLLPISLYLPTVNAIVLLMAAYQGAMFGGSVSAILINTPGTASAAATTLDGYQMALKGQAGKALQMALYASVTGGIIGTIILLMMAQPLSRIALRFGPPEYFGLMLLSLCLIAGISGKSLLKGLISAAIGLLLTTVGMDPILGVRRFTFGSLHLADGIQVLAIFIGLFAMAEILTQLSKGKANLNARPDTLKVSDKLSFAEYWKQKWNMLISGIMGAVIGVLPGVGGATACFIAYAEAKRKSKYPEKWGTGIIDGVAAPEAANNAVAGGALVPMLTLGIPGDVVTAILVGGLIAHGIRPGPLLFVNDMPSVYRVYVALFLACVTLLFIGRLGIPIFAKVVKLRKAVLLPLILIVCVVGVFSVRSNILDVMLMVGLGAFGFILIKNGFPIPPMVIAFVVGTMLEQSLRQSLLLSNNNPMIFFQRPISASLIIVAIIFAFFMVRRNQKTLKKELAEGEILSAEEKAGVEEATG